MKILTSLALCFLFCIEFVFAINCKGCTPLDTLTFDKMINNFRVSLIKFDVAYPYGDKHDEFAKVAVDGADIKDLFIGEVGIKDYGDKDNEELGQRFKVIKDDYPVVMLFVRNEKQILEEHRFSGDEFTSENLKNFLRQHSGIYLPLPGCIERFDHLADKMIQGGESGRKDVLEEAEKQLKALNEKKLIKKGELYTKIMKKIISEGEEFVEKETKRTKKMLEQKITDLKKTELNEKINVLRSFTKQEKPKDEL